MANYNSMKKEELVKALKERDAAIAGFEETNKLLSKEKDDLIVKVNGFAKDCECMDAECNNLRNKVNGLSDDLRKSNEICERLNKDRIDITNEKNAAKIMVEQKENIISTLKRQRVILGIITIVAILIAIIF